MRPGWREACGEPATHGTGLGRLGDGPIMEKWEVVDRWKTGTIREQEDVGQAVVERRGRGAELGRWELNPQPPWAGGGSVASQQIPVAPPREAGRVLAVTSLLQDDAMK